MKKYYFLLYIIILFSACYTSKNKTYNWAHKYNESQYNSEQLKILAHHINADSTAIYVKWINNQLNNATQISYFYELYNQQGIIIDSFGNKINPSKLLKIDTNTYYFNFNISTKQKQNYYLTLKTTHNFEQQWQYTSTVLIKDSTSLEQYFIWKDKQNIPYFNKYMPINTKAYIYPNIPINNISYGNFKHQLALPPFITEPQKIPLFIENNLIPYTNNTAIQLNANNLCIAKVNNTPASYINSVETNYPKLTNTSQLIETLRYITRNEEYLKLQNTPNLKSAIDSFWLQKAGSKERAKLLIKNYYRRLQKANELFTSYKQGWQTDRGLIYTIYGEPITVTQSKGAPYIERWTYIETDTKQQLTFVFIYKQNSLNFYDYELNRNKEMEDSWHTAIYQWRKGLINNPKQ